MTQRRLLALPILVLVLLHTGAGAQSNLSDAMGQNSSGEGRSSRNDMPGFQDVFESIGRTGTEWLREILGLRASGESQWDSNRSPRHALLTFITGMDAVLREGGTDYERITRTLPGGYNPDSAEARALKGVLDRLAPLNPVNFPDTSPADEKTITVYEVFPYGVQHEWVWERLGHAPDGEVVLVREPGKDEWRFSTETLEGAPKLLESMRPLPPVYPVQAHRDLLKSVFQPMADETPWWGWLILLASIVAGLLAGKWTKRGFSRFGNWMEVRTRPLLGSIVRSIGTSMGILTGVVVFVVGSSFVHFTQIFANIYWEVIQAILLIAVLWAFLSATDLLSTLLKNKLTRHDDVYGEMTVTIIHRSVNTILFTILLVFLLENVFRLNIGALITGLGIIGLALSLAGKESAQNLFGAISIFVNRPFVVGDWVVFKDNLGEVRDVRMQATHIRLLSGEMMIVPNMQFVSCEVKNLAMRKYLRREMNLSLPYGTPPEKVKKAREVVGEILERDDIVKEGKFNLEETPASISFSGYGDYYLNIKVYYWYHIGDDGQEMQRNSDRGWFTYLDHCTVVNQAILEAFDEHDIKIAFPTQTIELERKKGPGERKE